MNTKKEKILNLILPICTILCIFLIWFIVSINVKSEMIFPSIKQTFLEFFKLFTESEFYASLGLTLLRSFIAFLVSFLLAFLFAYLTKKSNRIEKVLSPIISIMRALPTVAIVFILLLWTNKFIAPIIVTMLVVLPTIYTGILETLNGIDKKQIEMCKIFNVEKKVMFTKVILPQIMPSMFLVIGSGLTLNLKLMVAAEVIAVTSHSIGNLINIANSAIYNTPRMFALVLVTIIIGVILEQIFNHISKKVGAYL